ncbi:2-amino-4-hydroxy-6-hydroxymethyldihydropteridine diphosphokinase [Flavihumibacter sp. UBA7668]|uniref:2-amino-4-hydroxy-6- hydroxymethyldihydropteridine diphosphokinase n=1 Tax=Flavihumibacter sp. UBA7668 TaxID=1946542 RepID=UPI0025C45AB3|nr:2-amino-4-hydroxy-6-hydroxymethyldihydropteridine diphosphokinase [Flavihumibacter sp. UBA7668]
MHTAYLLMGGNIGNREEYLKQAIGLIRNLAGRPVQVSSLYETAAWGKSDQGAFLNQAVQLETFLSAAALMTTLLLIEDQMGRKRLDRYGPRIIDIDILLYDQEVHQSTHINIPHPELPNRRFALEPLGEIAPDLIHPVLHKTIQDLLLVCKDPLPVHKITI